MRIAFFTAGSIGLGHVIKDIAIRRALDRAGFRGEYRSFHPPLSFQVPLPDHITQVPIRMEELKHPMLARESLLARELEAFRPDVLLIELFWVPMIWVAPWLDAEQWLLLRKTPMRWYEGPSFATFQPSNYDRILVHEPCEVPFDAEHIDPIVVANPDECQPPGALRRRLGLDDVTPLTVVMQAGLEGEAAKLRAHVSEGHVMTSDAFSSSHLFPAAEWLGDADHLLTAAGYGAYWESKWLGYFDRTHFVALPRPIDDQQWRVDVCRDVHMKCNGADQLARSLLAG